MNLRSRFLFPLVLAAGAAAACGGIADPTRTPGSETVTLSGSLRGESAPDGARVAIIWSNGLAGGLSIGADAPIVGGRFTLDLRTPPDEYFVPVHGDAYDDDERNVTPPSPPIAESPPVGGGTGLRPLNDVSGGVGTSSASDLVAAVAGFIVYRDGNGNGALDLDGDRLASSDEVLGGNDEMMLAYFRGGSTLDFERLRDRAGVLPKRGLNLSWLEQERWLAMSLLELQLDPEAALAGPVCSTMRYGAMPPTITEVSPIGTSSTDGDPGPYPSPDEVECTPDGRSWWYKPQPCEPPPPPPPGVCNEKDIPYGCAGIGGPASYPLDSADPVPEGWPCAVADPDSPEDAGAAPPQFDGGPQK